MYLGLFLIYNIVLLFSFVGFIECYCFNVQLPLNTTTVEGYKFELNSKGEITKCIFEDFGNETLEIPVNESRKNYEDCHDCLCSANGISCCGFGYNAGSIGVEDGYEIKHLSNCEYEISKTNSSTFSRTDNVVLDGNAAAYIMFPAQIVFTGVLFSALIF